MRALAVLLPGLALWFFPFADFTPEQRHLLAVFVATIIALVAHPVPMGVSALTAMTLLAVTGTLPPPRVLSGFANLTVWLVFAAFLFARAITVTQFGRRIAYLIIRSFGRSSLSLGYSVAVADLVLAPFVPSDTARGGGIMAPIVRSVAEAEGSTPGPTAAKLGSFLMLVGFHSTYTASAMFLTGMAANPLIADFARSAAHVNLTWIRWASGSIVPGLLAIALVPLLIHRMVPPADTEAATARASAEKALAEMGPVAKREWMLLAVMLGVMAGWITSPLHGLHNTIVALAGVSTLLLTGVITWDDLLTERRAWDALIWFAPLLMMADSLAQSGVIDVLSKKLFVHVTGLSWSVGLPVLLLAYLYLHYGFASMTAHVTALYPGFISAALLTGAPPLVAAMGLAYFSSIDASLTHYGTGSAPVYFGAGYVTQSTWWKVGFTVSLLQIVLWLGVGMLWWKILGWW